MRRNAMIGAAALLVLVVAGAIVAATSGTATRDESRPVTAAGSTGAAEPAYDASANAKLGTPMTDEAVRSAAGSGVGATAGMVAPQVPGGSGTIDPAGPRIVRTADVAIEVGDGKFGGAFDRAGTIASSSGGYVTSSSTASAGEAKDTKDKRARSGQLTLRVPSDRFQEVRTALGQLGEVEHESVTGADVSGQIVDYVARIRSLQAQEESLRVLVGKATNVGEVLQVQNSLFAVRQQIEQLQAQRLQLDQAASLATISVSLYEPGAALTFEPEPQPATGLADSFERAVDGSIAVIGGMVVVLGYVLPVAILGLLVWGGVRLRRRAAGRPAAPAPATP